MDDDISCFEAVLIIVVGAETGNDKFEKFLRLWASLRSCRGSWPSTQGRLPIDRGAHLFSPLFSHMPRRSYKILNLFFIAYLFLLGLDSLIIHQSASAGTWRRQV
jgi:hypothetical protein